MNLLWLSYAPPFETAWRESDSYAFSYRQWEPIRNSQLIRKYKEIPVYIRIQIPKADGPPNLKLLDEKVTAMRFHTVNENPFETVNLLENIRKYQYI